MKRAPDSTPEARAPAPNFDRVARVYRWCEYLALGSLLQRTRTCHLSRLQHCRRALVLGDGDGRFTAALLHANPTLSVTAVDHSGAMLRLLGLRSHFAAPRLQTYQADVRDYRPDAASGKLDLVATHFLLDCLGQAEVDALVESVVPALAPGACWLVSEFRVPPGALRWPARLYIRSLYAAFGLLTGLRIRQLPDHAAALARVGFAPVAVQHSLFGILTAELWRLGPSDLARARHRTPC